MTISTSGDNPGQAAGKVWLVTSGSYSDYGVRCAFATEALAEAFCQRENASQSRFADEYGVEEWALFDTLPDAWIAHTASAQLEANGSLHSVYLHAARTDGTASIDEGEGVHPMHGGGVRLVVNYRRSEDEARKALFDLAARVRAEREGIA